MGYVTILLKDRCDAASLCYRNGAVYASTEAISSTVFVSAQELSSLM